MRDIASVTDKGSQDHEYRGAEVQPGTEDPRMEGGPATAGSAAGSEPAVASASSDSRPVSDVQSDDAPDGQSGDSPDPSEVAESRDGSLLQDGQKDLLERRRYLPPVFEAPSVPPQPPARRDEPRDEPHDEPAEPPAQSETPSPAFTSAAFELFYPRDSDVPPTYQTRSDEPYGPPPPAPPVAEAPPAPPAASSNSNAHRKAGITGLISKIARFVGYAVLGYFALVLVLILAFRFFNPPTSALMIWRWINGSAINRSWVPVEQISSNLVRAVIVAEDGRFCDHYGIDFDAMAQAIGETTEGAAPRGASTISMQVTKNMFLWPAKSLVRKAIELPLTLVMEAVWPKRRILEVYLNVAELGPGIFGAEAAARAHFRRPAARLSERQASLLAASLPNPIVRDAGDPGPRTSRKARVIQARMRAAGPAVAACVL